MKIKTIMIKVPEDLHGQFKMAALKQKKTMTEILLEIVKKEVKKDQNEK